MNKIPKRDKTVLRDAARLLSESVRKAAFEQGRPFRFVDKDGWLCNEYPDGVIEKIKKIVLKG